jgi:hypothetical protein
MRQETPRDREPEDNDILWGAEAIGQVIGRTPKQIYYLIRIGALGNAARKLSHRTVIGSRSRLKALAIANDTA